MRKIGSLDGGRARGTGNEGKERGETLNNFERLIAAVCWVTPGLSLLVLFLWVSTPPPVYRHALWSFLSATAVTVASVTVAALGGGFSSGEAAEAIGVWMLFTVAGAYTLAVLANVAAALAGRGPFFASTAAGDQRVR